MRKTRHLNVKIDREDFEIAHANAKGANMNLSDFVRELCLTVTPEVWKWFKPMHEQYLKGKVKEELAGILNEKSDSVSEAADRLLKTIDEESEKLKKFFERFEDEKVAKRGK